MLRGGMLRSAMSLILIWLLVFSTLEAMPSVQTQKLPGRSEVGRVLMARHIDGPADLDAAIELKMDDFNSSLWASPASWAIVEFFAHWSFSLDDEKFENEGSLPANASDPIE